MVEGESDCFEFFPDSWKPDLKNLKLPRKLGLNKVWYDGCGKIHVIAVLHCVAVLDCWQSSGKASRQHGLLNLNVESCVVNSKLIIHIHGPNSLAWFINCQGFGFGVPGVSSKSWRYPAAWLKSCSHKYWCCVMSCQSTLGLRIQLKGKTESGQIRNPLSYLLSTSHQELKRFLDCEKRYKVKQFENSLYCDNCGCSELKQLTNSRAIQGIMNRGGSATRMQNRPGGAARPKAWTQKQICWICFYYILICNNNSIKYMIK